jgi:hypothetical protein
MFLRWKLELWMYGCMDVFNKTSFNMEEIILVNLKVLG